VLPVIVLVGRPNVGKSTLFNRLTASRDALVADQPGLTRDRKYGVGRLGVGPYVVVDTGGIGGPGAGVEVLMEEQVRRAIGEADHILFLVDAREGCSGGDEIIAGQLRRTGKPLTLVVNKAEGMHRAVASAEFQALGVGEPVAIAAAQGQGVRPLIEGVLAGLPPGEPVPGTTESGALVAVVGRPNVGKSTLINRLLGEERVIAFDQPGTTRDSIFIPFERDGQAYTLIDTAGVRRRSRVHEAIEKFSVIKTLQAIEEANVVLLVLDARLGIGEQDATLAGHVLEAGRALVVVVNKWDGLGPHERERLREELHRRLPFLDFAERRFVSALHGSGVGELYDAIDRAHANAVRHLSTPALNRILGEAVEAHAPPVVHGRRIKLRYAHQGGQNPPVIVVHGSQAEACPSAYQRYLINRFRKALDLSGTPLRLELRSGENPFAGRRNPLTERQVRKRERLKRFVKRKRR
jgi:GTP-binding protein